ncbi:MAG: hypothetical protein IIX99_05180 [Oscillospiraceae bacterium]|nr:hypothetical protein [Oscillospiraceae bacterium]
MITRREAALKWTVVALAALVLLFLHTLSFSRLSLWGVAPFLPPLIVAAVCSIENDLGSIIFSLVFGVLCDLSLGGLLPCLYTLAFFFAAVLILILGHSVLQPGFFCALISAAVSFLLTAALSFVALAGGNATFGECVSLFFRELLVSLPLLPLCFLVFWRIHKFFTV